MSFSSCWSRHHGRVTFMTLVLACTVGFTPWTLAAKESPPEAPKVAENDGKAEKKQISDHERMQGMWRIESYTSDGTKVGKDALKHMKVIIKKDTFALQSRGKTTMQLRYKVKANEKAKAKTKGTGSFDTTHMLGSGKPISQLGIFAFKGDRLQISIAPAVRPRPSDFKAAKGCSVFELTKEPKKAKKKPKGSQASS